MRSATLVTAPTVEPVTLAEAKQWARIDTTDEDTVLADIIIGVRQAAEDYTRRSFITQSWRLTLDLSCSGMDSLLGDGTYDLPVSVLYGDLPTVIQLPHRPIQSITSVTTYDLDNVSSVYASSNYYLDADGARFVLNRDSLWPTSLRPMHSAEILYVAGYGATQATVPMAIRNAIRMCALEMYESRSICSSGEDLPMKYKQILGQYRIARI